MGKRKKGHNDDPGSDSDSNLAIDLDASLTDTPMASDSRSSADPTSGRDLRDHDSTETYLDPLGSYIIIKPVDPEVSFRKVNVWAPPKQIQAICGPSVKLDIKALRDGSLMIKTETQHQTKLLLKQKTFCLKNVTVSLHKSLNQAKGTIFAPELRFMDEDELLEGMRGDGVTHVRRITTYRDGQRRNTNLLVLTFQTSRLPVKFTTGYLSFEVKPFIPNPLRCYKCQKFGHGKNSCDQPARCSDCAQPQHEGSPCQSPKKCVNCDSDGHGAGSKDCPQWQKEKKICEIKVTRDISYSEARKVVEAETSKTSKSYATVSAKQLTSTEMQTDPLPQLPPLKLLPPRKPATVTVSPAATNTQSQHMSKPSQSSGAISRNTSRGRSPSRKSSGSRQNRERSQQSTVRSRSPGSRSDHPARPYSSRPPSVGRGAVGPPVGQGQFFSGKE